jgi:hypothetical protein
MKLRINKKSVLAGATIGVVVGMAITAAAYWTSSGQGTGTSSVGTDTAWSVTTDAATGGPLTPAGDTETVAYHVTNNSTGHQQLHQVTIQVAGTSGTSPNATPSVYTHGSGTPACTKDDFTVGSAAAGATETVTVDQDLAPGDTYDSSVVVALVDRTDTTAGDGTGNQDNCRGENPPLFLAAS